MRQENRKRYVKRIKTVFLTGLLVAAQCAGTVLPVMAAPAAATGQESVRPAGQESGLPTGQESVRLAGQENGLPTGLPMAAMQVDETGLIPSYVQDIFDAEFYRSQYPDLAAAFGDNELALYQHFLQFGLKEGRVGSPILNIAKYRSLYPDLDAAFGDSWDLYVQHFFQYGISEGRSGGTSSGGSGAEAVYVNKKGSSYDNKGNVFIPWEVITSENYLTLETLRQRCGDTLVLLQDKNGNVTFVGGNFSNVKVTDMASAIESLHCMMKLLNFPEDTTELYATHVNKDSNGDVYYRFSAQEKETGYIYSDTDIIVGTGADGKVLCLSSSSGTRYYNTDLSKKEADWDTINAGMATDGWTLCSGGPVLKYDDMMNQYAWVRYYEKNGIVCEYYAPASTTANTWWGDGAKRYYNGMPGEDSYSFDFYFKKDIPTVEWEVKDYHKNTVKLPMAYEEGKGYYLLDKTRKIVGVNSDDWLTPCYFESKEKLAKYYISAITNMQSVWDTYNDLGLFENPTPILFTINNDDPSPNAFCGYDCGVLNVEINCNEGTASYDILAHELAHGVLAKITGGLKYYNATGAINESYADILGNLLEMIAVGKGNIDLGQAGADNWLYGEGVTGIPLRDMITPGNCMQPDKVGGAYFEMDTNAEYAALNDNGGVHFNSGILNRICYRMYAEAGISKNELFLLWYDTLQQLNEDSDYGSIRRYMEYALRRHGLEDKIDKVNQIFDEGRVDSYVKGTTWKEMEAATGTSKVTLNFTNIPDNVDIVSIGFEQGKNGYVYIDNDSAGTPGALLKEGSSLNAIYVDPKMDYVSVFSGGVFGILKDPVVGAEDRDLVIDYRDVLAAELTKNNVELSGQYAEGFVEVTFALVNNTDNTVTKWSIILERPDENVDVTFDISVNSKQEVQSESSGNTSSVYLPRRAVLRNDSEYTYTITLMGDGDAQWTEKATLNTGDIQPDKSGKVIINFKKTEDGGGYIIEPEITTSPENTTSQGNTASAENNDTSNDAGDTSNTPAEASSGGATSCNSDEAASGGAASRNSDEASDGAAASGSDEALDDATPGNSDEASDGAAAQSRDSNRAEEAAAKAEEAVMTDNESEEILESDEDL